MSIFAFKISQRLLSTLLITLLVLAVMVFPVQAVLAEDWPQFQKDLTHTGYTSELGPTSANTTKEWKASLYAGPWNGIDTTPVVADGQVFCLSSAGHVYAYSVNGSYVWDRSLGSGGTYSFELSTPAYGDGNLFVALHQGTLHALNATTGATVWSANVCSTTAQINTPIVYDSDGYLYFGTWNGRTYYCYDSSNGSQVWARAGTHNAGYYWAGACVIGDYLVFGGDDGYLTCVEKTTGDYVDEFDLGDNIGSDMIRASVTYDSGYLYTTDKDGYLHAIEFVDGYFYDGPWDAVLLNNGVQSTSTPVVYGGKIYAGTGQFNGGAMHCRNQSDGTLAWNYSGIGGVQSSPAVSVNGDDIYIYFTTNSQYGKVYCLDDSGGLVWSYNPDEYGNSTTGYILQGVAIYGGRVFFGNDGAYLYSLIDGD